MTISHNSHRILRLFFRRHKFADFPTLCVKGKAITVDDQAVRFRVKRRKAIWITFLGQGAEIYMRKGEGERHAHMTVESITTTINVAVPVAYFLLSSYSLGTTVAIYTAASILVSLGSTVALYKMIVNRSKSLVQDNDHDDLDGSFKNGQ